MNEKIRKWIPLLVLLVFLVTIFVPRWVEERVCMAYGEPLFNHALPEGSVLVSKDAAKDDEGVITAALLLQTDLNSEELEAFYADLDCQPAEEGQTVYLEAKPLDEDDLAVLKQAKLYVEGESYQFVYVYSK